MLTLTRQIPDSQVDQDVAQARNCMLLKPKAQLRYLSCPGQSGLHSLSSRCTEFPFPQSLWTSVFVDPKGL